MVVSVADGLGAAQAARSGRKPHGKRTSARSGFPRSYQRTEAQRRTRAHTCEDVAHREEGRASSTELGEERRAALGDLKIVVNNGWKRHIEGHL